MKIAMTGATGFIGEHVRQKLQESYEVVTIGRRPSCELKADLAEPESVSRLDLGGYDVLVHCAGVVDEDFYRDPYRAWAQAVLGFEELATRAVTYGVRQFIYFSTSHVYGSFKGIVSETRKPDPLSSYAIAHYAGEQILKRFAHRGDIGAVVLRPNAVYGVPLDWEAFDRWSLVPFDLPLQAVYTGHITLKTTGQQRRNFINACDLAFYVDKLLKKTEDFERFVVVNPIGSETMSIYNFACQCATIFEETSGKICPVVRTEPTGSVDGEDFEFVSVMDEFRPVKHVNQFIKEFITKAIDKIQQGKSYGQSKNG
jgi:UDP-glucose 4-epimerase